MNRPLTSPWDASWLGRHLVWLALCIAYLSVFPYFERINNPNENVRIWMTRAIVNHHELAINRASAEWGYVNDKAKQGTRIYSSKAPGTSLLGVPVLYVHTQLARLVGSAPLGKRATTLALRVFAVAIPMCLFLLFFKRQLERVTAADPALRNLLLAGLGLGTMLFPYGVLFVGHAQAAALAFAGFALLESEPREHPRRGRLALAGALTGFAVVFEYQVGIAAAIIAGYACLKHRRSALAFFAGTIPAVLILGGLHTALFGRPWILPFDHLENPEFGRLHNQARLFGFNLPSLKVTGTVLFSVDLGLFVFSPFLLLGLLGAIVALVRGPRLEGATVLLIVLGMVAFLAGVPNWHAGWCVGPRYIAVVVPFLAWSVLFLARAPKMRAVLGPVLGGLVIVSVILCGLSGAVYPHYPEVFDNPVFDLTLPLLRDGYQPYSLGWLLGLRGPASLIFLAAAATIALGAGLVGRGLGPGRGALHVLLALAVAFALLFPQSRYGRKPRPVEAAAQSVVRSAWEPASRR